MKTILIYFYLCFFVIGIFGCIQKYDKEKTSKFNHLYFYDADKAKLRSYFIEIEKYALNINPNATFDVRYNLPDRVFSFPFEVNYEHIKENKYKSYIFKIYHKEDAIVYLNWFNAEKENMSYLPKSYIKLLNENYYLAKKIVKKCDRNKSNFIKIDYFIYHYTRYLYKYNIEGKDIYVTLTNCENNEGQMIINQVIKDEELTKSLKSNSFTLNKNDLNAIQKKNKKNANYILTFKSPYGSTLEVNMSLINGRWKYKQGVVEIN